MIFSLVMTKNLRQISCSPKLTSQDPIDAWMIQEMLWDLRPDLVIETGTFNGVGAVFMPQ